MLHLNTGDKRAALGTKKACKVWWPINNKELDIPNLAPNAAF